GLSGFVSGHGFSCAETALPEGGFSRCHPRAQIALIRPPLSCTLQRQRRDRLTPRTEVLGTPKHTDPSPVGAAPTASCPEPAPRDNIPLPRMDHNECAMRIGLIAPPFISVPPKDYGGTELFIAQLAEGLYHRGLEVVVYTNGESTVDVEKRCIYPTAQWPIKLDGHAFLKDAEHTAWAMQDAASYCD